jgi:hypothetical protein
MVDFARLPPFFRTKKELLSFSLDFLNALKHSSVGDGLANSLFLGA